MDNKEKPKAQVSLNHDINVHEGEKNSDANAKGVHNETDKKSVNMNDKEMGEYALAQAKRRTVRMIISIVLMACAIGGYIFLGSKYGSKGWSYGWLVFLLAIILDSLASAIEKKKPSEFAYVILVVFVYLLLGLFKSWWHPAWVLFLTIPLYYWICNKIQNRSSD